MVSAWRNFKNIFSRPLFTIIFRLEMLKFHPYFILTGDTMVGFVIFCVLKPSLTVIQYLGTFFSLIFSRQEKTNSESWTRYNDSTWSSSWCPDPETNQKRTTKMISRSSSRSLFKTNHKINLFIQLNQNKRNLLSISFLSIY